MIQKYKQGDLSDEQMSKLEEDLMAQMFRRQEDNRLRDDLKKLATEHANDDEKEPINKENTGLKVVHRANRQRLWWAAAASVAVIIAASWWLFLKPQKAETDSAAALADSYLKKDIAPLWLTTMDNTTVEKREAAAKEAYEKADFTQAVGLFEAIPPTKKEHYFYLGIAALKQSKPDAQKAVDNLLKTRASAGGWQEDATNWYLALAYLQLGKKAEAQTELNNIVKLERDNVKRAEEILKKLE